MSILRAAPLPAFVMPPWRRVLPLECSDGTRPRYAMSWRGLAKRVMSPSSATSVAAATSAMPRSASARAPSWRPTSPAVPPRCERPDGRAVPSRLRRPRYSPPARCDARHARSAGRPATADASASTPDVCSDGLGAIGSRTAADGPDAGRAALAEGHALAQRRLGRGGGPDLRAALLPAGLQGPHAAAGEQPARHLRALTTALRYPTDEFSVPGSS